ncbi:TIGR04540 family protein [Planococcus lenghuensis]|uniref:TIGR04540 family protein n=1 Tax=Planococcus lenghuensis TaxID=2213202 RepID=UPI001E434E1B|nr:TIGR04540 family protein [Planococcus lenghuensis]
MRALEVKLFYRTQRDLAIALNQLIDSYFEEEIPERKLIENIVTIHENNKHKLVKNHQFTTVIQQHCGKRRLAVVERVLEMK